MRRIVNYLQHLIRHSSAFEFRVLREQLVAVDSHDSEKKKINSFYYINFFLYFCSHQPISTISTAF